MATGTITNVISTGSNTNGYYCKFSDGTLIQYGHVLVSFSGSMASGSITMPYSFISDPAPTFFIMAQSTSVERLLLKCGANASGNNFDYTVATADGTSYSSSRNLNWFAIGRWK